MAAGFPHRTSYARAQIGSHVFSDLVPEKTNSLIFIISFWLHKSTLFGIGIDSLESGAHLGAISEAMTEIDPLKLLRLFKWLNT